MLFHVSRTSGHDEDEAPCKGAKKRSYVRFDERTTNDPKKIQAYKGKEDWWYAEGRNHRVEKGHIFRDFDDEDWFIEINTLDELMAFVAKHGDIVISPHFFLGGVGPSIEIYDTYRE